MPLETATFIPDLVPTNPAHTDGLSQADSHMRLIKSTLKNTFPNFTDVALQSTQAQVDAAVASTTGAATSAFNAGTAALPGLHVAGDPDTGFFSPTADQIGASLNGAQVLLLAGNLLVTSLAIGAPAIASTGAYSGGTGQLVPIGAVLEWFDDVLPAEGGYAWANGQIIANANVVAPVLLARWGNRFGGNGTTTMGVPDRRETVAVGKSTMGGAAARGLLSNFVATVTNAVIGAQSLTLQRSDLPNFQPAFSGTTEAVNVTTNGGVLQGTIIGGLGGGGGELGVAPGASDSSITSSGTFTPSGTIASLNGNVAQTSPSVVQPSTIVNYIIRIG